MKTPFFKKICLLISFILVSSCTGGVNNEKYSSSTFDDITKIEDIENIDISKLKNKKITITIWNAFSNNQYNKINQYINEFKKIYPNVDILQTSKGNMSDLDYSLYAAVFAKSTPTIAILEHSYVPDYISYGAVEILNSYLEANNINDFDDNENDYIEAFIDNGKSFSLDENIYTLPLFNYSNVLFYNSEYINNLSFDMNSLSWFDNSENSIVNLARKIKENNPKIIPLYIEKPESLYKILSMQLSIPYTKLTGTVKGDFLFTNKIESVELLRNIKTLIDEGLLILGKELDLPSNYNPLTKVAMAIAPTNYYSKYELPNNRASVALIPQENKNNLFNEIISDDFIIFKNEPIENKIMAYLFYKYITNKKNSVDYSLYCDSMPIRYNAIDSQEFQNVLSHNNKTLQSKLIVLYDNIYSNLIPMPSFIGSRTCDKEIQDMLITLSNNDLSKKTDEEINEFIRKCLIEAYKNSIIAQGNN